MILELILAAQVAAAAPPPYTVRPTLSLTAREWGRRDMWTPDLTCRVKNRAGEYVRSRTRRAMFLRALGLGDKPPAGWYVDHIVPLACGGCDVPSNMSLLDEEQWKAKMLFERKICGQQGASQ